jgi:ribosomal protein L14E/L6E/L27E
VEKQIGSFRYCKSRNRYEKSNLWIDLEKMVGYSYNWYRILDKIDGIVVLNIYSYSRTTVRHFGEIAHVLRCLDQNYVTIEAPRGLKNLDASVALYRSRIDQIKADIAAPRSRAKTNIERLKAITALEKYEKVALKLKNARDFESEMQILLSE